MWSDLAAEVDMGRILGHFKHLLDFGIVAAVWHMFLILLQLKNKCNVWHIFSQTYVNVYCYPSLEQNENVIPRR
jgi:hypothetical protein